MRDQAFCVKWVICSLLNDRHEQSYIFCELIPDRLRKFLFLCLKKTSVVYFFEFVRCSISKNYLNVGKNSFVFNDYKLVNHLVSGKQHLVHATC